MNVLETPPLPKAKHEARVLLLNHRLNGCASLIRGLEVAGFAVTGIAVTPASSTDPVHLVVVAISGVDDSACSVVEQLRQSERFAATPILVISDRFDPSVAEEYLHLGATDFLSQPSAGRVLSGWCERILNSQQSDWLFEEYVRERRRSGAFDRVIIPLSLALFGERDHGRMLETILLEAKALCLADGGTLYLRTSADTLEFTMVHNDVLGISLGGSKGSVTEFPPIPLYRPDGGEPERRYIAAYVANSGLPVSLPDLYDSSNFDLSGPRNFDTKFGYRTLSILAAPLKNDAHRVIGVLQLINARDPLTGEAVPFDPQQQEAVESMCRLAAAGLEAYARMQKLKEQISALHLKIDEAKKREQVSQIVDSDYFKNLKEKARQLRMKTPRA